jgi:two-component system LytT family response regulator
MKCVIIDDDLGCIEALNGIISNYCPQLDMVGSANTIDEGVRLINAMKPQLVFLDVEIHDRLGFDLFRFFPKPDFEVVFTTAHEKYALKAIKSSCYDYLLKPILIEELVNVVTRLESENGIRSSENLNVLLSNLESQERVLHKIAIPSTNGYSFVQIDDIVLMEGDGKYTKINTVSGQKYLSTKNIGEFESLLPSDHFFRTHKSWLVNLHYLLNYDKGSSRLYLQGDLIAEVSLRKKEEFMKLFDRA